MFKRKVRYWSHSSKTKCVFVENPESSLISIDIWVKAGVFFEKKNQFGVAHLLEHMIFKGSTELNPGEFDLKIESLGGSSNASTGYDDAHYYVLIPPSNFKESLSLLTNLVLNPKISEEELELEKLVVVEEINQQIDQPDENLFDYFTNRFWIEHPYGKSILGNEREIQKLQSTDLEEFHHENYTPEGMCLAISGDLPKDLTNILEDCEFNFREERENRLKTFNQNIISRTGREEIYIDKLELSRIYKGWLINSISSQKITLGFEILASILAEGRTSRLVNELKEKNNLVESVFADINTGEFGNTFILELCLRKENLDLVESKLEEIVDKTFNDQIITEVELRRAINLVKSNYVFNMETSSQLTSFYGCHFLWERKDPLKEFERNLNYLSKPENFKEIFGYIKKECYTLVAKRKCL